MMYYYKYIDPENGELVTIQEFEEKPDIDSPYFIEITEEEYNYLDEHVNWYRPQ